MLDVDAPPASSSAIALAQPLLAAAASAEQPAVLDARASAGDMPSAAEMKASSPRRQAATNSSADGAKSASTSGASTVAASSAATRPLLSTAVRSAPASSSARVTATDRLSTAQCSADTPRSSVPDVDAPAARRSAIVVAWPPTAAAARADKPFRFDALDSARDAASAEFTYSSSPRAHAATKASESKTGATSTTASSATACNPRRVGAAAATLTGSVQSTSASVSDATRIFGSAGRTLARNFLLRKWR